MKEIRLHGRGGQGAVTASEILAHAAFIDGKSSQAFPSFGSERKGAPVQAFARISDARIRTRAQIVNPDFVIIQDPTLIGVVDCLVLSILAFVLGTRFVKELPDQYLKKDSQAYKGKFKRYFFLLKPRFMAWKKLKLFYAKKASMKKSYL